MMTAPRFVRIVVALALWACATPPVFAQGVGAIGGTITDSSGAVLPGATVTLSNPRGSIGGNQEAVPDARGAFKFPRLDPCAHPRKVESEHFRATQTVIIVVYAEAT